MWSLLRNLLVMLVILLVASPLGAGTIVRGNKAAGGTAFSDDTAARADEVNEDFDRLYTLVNGEVESVNIKDATIVNADVAGGAAIAYSKMLQTAAQEDADIVDDYSANDAEQATSSSPGTSDSTTKATNLQEEIAQLRHKIEALTVGNSAAAVAAAGGTAATASWIDGPHRPSNHIYNGSFDLVMTLATGADGDGWVRTHTPTTLAQLALVESEEGGHGNAIRIIDSGDNSSGIKQTLDGLKAGTKYELIARVQDDVGTCTVGTSGADTNELTLTSDDSGNWQILSGTFETDSTPTDVDIELLAVASGGPDDCSFTSVAVYEINDDPLPISSTVIEQDCATADHTTQHNPPGDFDTDSVEVTVTAPGPNYVFEVSGFATSQCGGGGGCTMEIAIEEDSGAPSEVRTGFDEGALSAYVQVALDYVKKNPTPGTAYTYTLQIGNDADATLDFDVATEDACIIVKMYRGM